MPTTHNTPKQKKKNAAGTAWTHYPCVLRFITLPQPQGKAQKGEGNDSGWKGPTTVISSNCLTASGLTKN